LDLSEALSAEFQKKLYHSGSLSYLAFTANQFTEGAAYKSMYSRDDEKMTDEYNEMLFQFKEQYEMRLKSLPPQLRATIGRQPLPFNLLLMEVQEDKDTN
jgi:hypothetical protein